MANTEYYLLILKRKQSFVFIGYGIASLLSFFTVNPVVAMGGFFLRQSAFSLHDGLFCSCFSFSQDMGRENLRAVHERFLPHEAKSYSRAKGGVKPGAKVEATTIAFLF